MLRPAATTDAWRHDLSLRPAATTGLHGRRSARPRQRGDSRSPCGCAQALETPGKRAVLVTTSRFLGRRVAAELLRWGIRVDDSAGIPLDQSPPGTFLLLTAHLVAGDAAPVALLVGPEASIGQRRDRTRASSGAYVRALERGLLRGPRLAGGLDGLVAALRGLDPDAPWAAPVPPAELQQWLERLAGCGAAVRGACWRRPGPSLPAMLEAHLAFAEWLAADELGDAGELWAQGRRCAARTSSSASCRWQGRRAGEVPASAYPALLAVLIGPQSVRPRQAAHPRLAILGQLEGRLVQADLVLIGGLNEGRGPASVDAGPWLNRAMRRRAGPAAGRAGASASRPTIS